ncbi:MAG: CPBP family intramembrane glutamic endopeptidase [Anaerolineales bacterium]
MNQAGKQPTAKRYLALYFALTIPLAWLFWIPMTLIQRGIWTPPVPVPMLVWSTLGAASPLIALSIIERVSDGEVKLQAIFERVRLREWRSPWTLASPVIIIGIHLLMTVSYFGVAAVQGVAPGPLRLFDPEVFATLGWWILLVMVIHFFSALLTSPVLEEPGWRGFAFEQLQHYVPRDVASLIVGSYWWLWHQGMNVAFDLMPTPYGYLSMLLDSFAIDALYTLSGGNLFAAMLAHQGMGTVFTFLIPLPNLWYLLVIKLAAIAALRDQIHRRMRREK